MIAGRVPTEEELKEIAKYLKDGEAEQVQAAKETTTPIADYWLKAFQTHQELAQDIKEADEPILKHL